MSNRIVKCRYCSEKGRQKDYYTHQTEKEKMFFCNETHFKQFFEDKENRQLILSKCDDLFGIRVSNDTLFLKELKEYKDNYKALNYLLEDRFLDLDISLHKEFKTLNFKIKYFFAIIKKDIQNYITQVQNENVKYVQLEIVDTNFVKPVNKKTILEIIKENKQYVK